MRAQTINVNADFRRAYGRGRSKADSILVSYALRTRRPVVRCGITTSKKIGSAVERNRCRRIIRAAYVQMLPELPKYGWDFVFVARGRTKDVKSTDILRSMRGQLKVLLNDNSRAPSSYRSPQRPARTSPPPKPASGGDGS
ncbi:MAG: ribonuclease P protein component [Oscillospiraceae bacterium]|jgi:ribonuclease P protein component|nr:ribonuclease P protein component [Oscillospiraceae bacterium]